MNQQNAPPPNAPAPAPGYQGPPIEEDEIDLADLIRTLWGHRWVIVGVAFLVIVLGGTYGYMQEPPYQAETLLAPAQGEEEGGPSVPGGLGGLASMAGVSIGGGGGQVENALATLKSRKFLSAFIADRELRPELFAEKWDADQEQWDVESEEEVPTEGDAYGKFKKILSVSRNEESGLVTLSITWKDRHQAAEWANALVERLNRQIRQEEIARLDRKIGYLRTEVDRTSVSGVRQALFSIMESELKSQTVAKTQQEYVFRVIDPAFPPAEGDTTGTSLKLVLALSGVLGGFLGIFVAFVREFIRNNFSAPEGSQEEPD